MPITINLPQVGESVTEGVIGKWLKRPGDALAKYESLVEVVTDKVTMEVPSPYGGILTAILVKEGDRVPMGAPIAQMETKEVEETRIAHAVPLKEEKTAPPSGRTGVLLRDVRPTGPTGAGEEPLTPQVAAPITASVVKPVGAPTKETEAGHQRYSPIVRRMAAEHGIDLSQVSGTGSGGRVTKEDVERYMAQRTAVPSKAEAVPTAGRDEEVVALTPLRRLIADNMVKSAQVPQAGACAEADVTGLVARRDGAKEEFRQREGVELTYLPFFIKAAVESLKEHPLLNSAWGGDKIVLKRRMNMGIAVATPQGLVVPVIHDADKLSIAGLARACHDLIQRARDGKLALADVQGGTFTLNNTGAFGSLTSRPLLVPGQAAILATEAIVKRPVVLPGDAIAVRSVMNVCISFDHRILDGAEVGAFLASVKRRLETIGPDTAIY